MTEDTTPVIIGVGRSTQKARALDVAEALDPIGLLALAAREAASDAVIGSHIASDTLFNRVDVVSTVQFLMEERVPKDLRPLYKNPPLGLARSLGLNSDALCLVSYYGGDKPQVLVNDLADRLASGQVRMGVIAGGECLDTFMRASKQGRAPGGVKVRDAIGRVIGNESGNTSKPLAWGDDRSVPDPVIVGHVERVATKQEAQHGLASPPNTYAILDQALRHHLGRSTEVHSQSNAELFSGFSKVAANNKDAWFSTARSSNELKTVSRDNRAVTSPGYPKYLNAVMDVDQAGALIMTTVSEARALGVPPERWVYLHGCAEAEERPIYLTERPELHRCHALKFVGEEVSRAANIPLSKCEHLEIYSCFPVAVEIACRELGLDEDRVRDGSKLTLLGGLPYYGGPGNSYALLGITAMCQRLRSKPGSFGLVTSNGGFVTKHSAGIYSTTPYKQTHPDASCWTRRSPSELQRELEKQAATPIPIAAAPSGTGCVESCTVEHARDGPSRAIFIGKMLDGPDIGKRFIANSKDDLSIQLVLSGHGIGSRGTVDTSKGRATFLPLDAAVKVDGGLSKL